MTIRLFIGWVVGCGFILSGMRRRKIHQYDQEGSVLSIAGHSPTGKTFSRLIAWLIHEGFSFISTDELLAMSEGKIKWRKRIVWLTFDDGWLNFRSDILPTLEKYKIPATIFIAPMESLRGQIWTNSIMPYVAQTKIDNFYKLEDTDRYGKIDEILACNENRRTLMNKDEIVSLSRHSLVTIENHTLTHLSCSHHSVETVIRNVDQAQCILREWVERVPRMLCYPFGHVTVEIDNAVLARGFRTIHSEAGKMSLFTVGIFRNFFKDNATFAENSCRVVNAWLSVHIRGA